MSALASRVRTRREAKEMSQAQLATSSKTTQSTVSRIEHGQLLNPGAQTLMRLAGSLDVSVDYILGRTDEPGEADALAGPKGKRLLECYSKLTEAGQSELLAFAEFLLDKRKETVGRST